MSQTHAHGRDPKPVGTLWARPPCRPADSAAPRETDDRQYIARFADAPQRRGHMDRPAHVRQATTNDQRNTVPSPVDYCIACRNRPNPIDQRSYTKAEEAP